MLLIWGVLALNVVDTLAVLVGHGVHVLSLWVTLLRIGNQVARHVDQILQILVTDSLSKTGTIVDDLKLRVTHVVVGYLVKLIELVPVNLVFLTFSDTTEIGVFKTSLA